MHLLKASIGNGLLFLPHGYKKTGYVMGIICSICIGTLCTHTVVTLVRCSQLLCKRHHIPMLDFAGTVEVAFENGPEVIRKYSKIASIVTNVIVCFVHVQAGVIYTLYVSTSFQQVIEHFSEHEMNVRIYIMALFPIICIFAFVPNLKYLAPFSVVGFLFMLTGFCVALYYLFQDFPNPGRLKPFTSVLPIPMYCTLFLYSLHNVTLCMPLENSMENPRRLPQLITYNMLANTCLYTTFGFFGYNKYMDETCDTVIKNLPIDDPLAQTIKVTISLSVMFSFGLAYYVPFSIIWPKIQPLLTNIKFAKSIFRFAGVILTTLIAIAIPQLIPLLGLLTAISMTTIMLLVPIVTETATKWKKATRFLIAKNISISVLWILLLLVGTIESMLSIIREYGGGKQKGC
ncbi:Proton-coupled amino acid transporter-like protein pathetic [Anthophora quadrimaculata]